MAVTKASASGLTGNKFKDASAGTTKIADIVDAPTITGITTPDDTNPTIAFTTATRGAVASSFTVFATAVVGGTTFTKTGVTSSPTTMTGLTPNADFNFTVAGVNAQGVVGTQSASFGPITTPNPPYSLSQDFASSGTYTVPAGKTLLSVVVIGGASGGNAASGFNGGNGGSGTSSAHGATGIPVAGGQTYSVTLAGAGGTSSFGNLLTSSGGGNATNKVGPSGGGGGGGNGGFKPNQQNTPGGYHGNSGNAGGAGGNITITDIGLVQWGGGGGGGGGGGQSGSLGAGGGGGGAGGAQYGASGGGGGGSNRC